MPLLKAMLQAQPTVNIKSYQQLKSQLQCPRQDTMEWQPQVGNTIKLT